MLNCSLLPISTYIANYVQMDKMSCTYSQETEVLEGSHFTPVTVDDLSQGAAYGYNK